MKKQEINIVEQTLHFNEALKRGVSYWFLTEDERLYWLNRFLSLSWTDINALILIINQWEKVLNSWRLRMTQKIKELNEKTLVHFTEKHQKDDVFALLNP